MSSWPPCLVRFADSARRISPAHVPHVGFLWTLEADVSFGGIARGVTHLLDEVSEGLEEVGSLCY